MIERHFTRYLRDDTAEQLAKLTRNLAGRIQCVSGSGNTGQTSRRRASEDAGYRNSSRTTEKSSSNTCRPVNRSANARSTLTREAPAGVGVRTTSRS